MFFQSTLGKQKADKYDEEGVIQVTFIAPTVSAARSFLGKLIDYLNECNQDGSDCCFVPEDRKIAVIGIPGAEHHATTRARVISCSAKLPEEWYGE